MEAVEGDAARAAAAHHHPVANAHCLRRHRGVHAFACYVSKNHGRVRHHHLHVLASHLEAGPQCLVHLVRRLAPAFRPKQDLLRRPSQWSAVELLEKWIAAPVAARRSGADQLACPLAPLRVGTLLVPSFPRGREPAFRAAQQVGVAGLGGRKIPRRKKVPERIRSVAPLSASTLTSWPVVQRSCCDDALVSWGSHPFWSRRWPEKCRRFSEACRIVS